MFDKLASRLNFLGFLETYRVLFVDSVLNQSLNHVLASMYNVHVSMVPWRRVVFRDSRQECT